MPNLHFDFLHLHFSDEPCQVTAPSPDAFGVHFGVHDVPSLTLSPAENNIFSKLDDKLKYNWGTITVINGAFDRLRAR